MPTLLVSFARSGDSPESVAAAELADQLLSDVHHLVLTCNADGRLAAAVTARMSARTWLLMPERRQRPGLRHDVELHEHDARCAC